MRTIIVPGGSLFTISVGASTRPPAMMVHSGTAHLEMWLPLMRALEDELFSVAYDCRCFGRSTTKLEGEYSDTDDLASVFDAYELESAVVVAASRGGRIAIDFALTHPEKVRGLFLAAPDISGFDAPVAENERALYDAIEAAEDAWLVEDIIANELRLWVDGPSRGQDEERAALRQSVAEMSRVNYAQQRDTPDFTELEPPAAERLSEVTCPVRVLAGDEDAVGMKAMAAAIESSCPRATLARIADAAHMLVLERPDVVERELRSWLRAM